MSNNNDITAYPLSWPFYRKRCVKPKNAPFKTTFGKARDLLVHEIKKIGGSNIIISTNIPLRRDGLPYASSTPVIDSGVAVYFNYKDKQMCFACDKWSMITHNIQAIYKTLEALRGIERWGSGDMRETAFSGFIALPSPAPVYREILGLSDNATLADAEKSYKELRSRHHPDKGGSVEMFDAIQKAWELAKQVLK